METWADKYCPRDGSELVGNGPAVGALRRWLRAERREKHAVLISGPPGTGKTAAARLVAEELKFRVVEVNAGERLVAFAELGTSVSLAPLGSSGRRHLLLVDGVDGAGDRGWIADLMAIVRAGRVPVVCICNDKYCQRLRALRGLCLDLDFSKPSRQQVMARLMHVCRREGLDTARAEEALGASDRDLRLALGQLQLLALGGRGMRLGKDAELSSFEAARLLLNEDPQMYGGPPG